MSEKKFPKVVAGALIYNEKGEIFLAQSHKWKNKWIVPGGKVDWGESLEECVKREIKEETGLEIMDIEFVQFQESVFSEECSTEQHFIFLNFCCRAASKNVVLNDELQKYVWINPREALKLDLNSSTRRFIVEQINIKNTIRFDPHTANKELNQ